MADVAIVKGETPAADRARLFLPDGTARRAVMHVVLDLPRLAVESAFGIDDGLWGTLARGGQRYRHLRLVTDTPCADPGPGQLVGKAAVNAVLNRWGRGPDTPAGVRQRLAADGPAAAALAQQLDDEAITLAAAGAERLCRDWSTLPVGGTLRLTWPLPDSWLRALMPSRRTS